MGESILDRKIKSWEDQLLDLGKRNKMISFRESKRATLNILQPGFEELYQQIVVEEKELTFQKAIDRDSDARVYSILSLLDKLSCPIEVNIGDIRAQGSLPETKKTLKHLRAKARLAIDEQGTNILYLVFGFIEWREKGNRGDSWLKSPLLLVPVSLSLPSLNGQYILRKHEDELVVNPTLAYLFERDYGISLPEFDSEKDSLENFMQKLEQLADDRGWRILRECSMGLVSFHKISMYHDLLRNEAQLKENPIIRAFAGEAVEDWNGTGNGEFDHDAIRSVDSFQVLDADSSQQDAIALSQQGVSFVLEGPPGSGKSQTITNIIAQALADGKKILFVSEKMAALDVVLRRLEDVQLADFCLSLHSHKANKKDVLNQLGANLNLQRRKVKDEEIAKLTRLDMLRQQLKAYVQDIHRTIEPLEMSLYEVYGAIAQLGLVPDIPLHLTEADKLSKDDVNRLALMVSNLDKAQAALGPQWYKNPWQGYVGTYLETGRKRDLQNQLQDAAQVLSALEKIILKNQSLAEVLSLDSLADFWELCRHSRYCAGVPNSWFHRPIEEEERMVTALRDQKQAIDSLLVPLVQKYGPELRELSGKSACAKLVSAMQAYCAMEGKGTTEEEAFLHMEDNLSQLRQLTDYFSALLTALEEFSHAYNLTLDESYESVETVLEICHLLLENRKPTQWYFEDGQEDARLQYVAELRQQLSAYFNQKHTLCNRYGEDILDRPEVQAIYDKVNGVVGQLKGLPHISTWDFHRLRAVAGTDTASLNAAEEACKHPAVSAVSDAYGLTLPRTFGELKQQIVALEIAKGNGIPTKWKTPTGRKKAAKLLQEAANKSDKLTENKNKLNNLFHRCGICLSADTMTENQIDCLLRFQPIEQAQAIVPAAMDSATYEMLDELDANIRRYRRLAQQIEEFRSNYQVQDTLTTDQILEGLNSHRSARLCAPCQVWANSRAHAAAVLNEVSAQANSLKEMRRLLLETYEESVFSLDYMAMLNRFKAEYTNITKYLRPSYQADMRALRLACKQVRKKIGDEEAIALLQSLRQYHESYGRYQAMAQEVSALLNVPQYDLEYDWAAMEKRLRDFGSVAALFCSDAAAYRFLAEGVWDFVQDTLSRFEMLKSWFGNHAIAKNDFGDLYRGMDTDVDSLRSLLEQAKVQCSIFHSPDFCLAYGNSAKDNQAVSDCICDLLSTKKWLSDNFATLRECAGCDAAWADSLDRLRRFESVIAVVGEGAYELVQAYPKEKTCINRYQAALNALAHLYDFAKTVEIDIQDSMEIRDLLTGLRSCISGAADLQEAYSALFANPTDTTLSVGELLADMQAVLRYRQICNQLPRVEAEATEKLGQIYQGRQTDWDALQAMITRYNRLSGKLSRELKAAFADGMTHLSLEQLLHLQEILADARAMEGKYLILATHSNLIAKRNALSEGCAALTQAAAIKHGVFAAAYGPCTYSEVLEDLQILGRAQSLQRTFEAAVSDARAALPTLNLQADTDWAAASEIFGHVRQIKRAIHAGGVDASLLQLVTNGMEGIPAAACYAPMKKLMDSQKNLTDIIALFDSPDTLRSWNLAKLSRKIRGCLDEFATMDAWIDLRNRKKICEDNGLGPFVAGAEDAYYPVGQLQDVFLKSFYYAWFEQVCSGLESVAGFRVSEQQNRVESFRSLDAHRLPVDRMRIRERLIGNMPAKNSVGRATDEMSVLQHELGKKRNIMPLRKLFRTIPNLLLRLKPCLMMSPLSVSHFLEAETYRFDVVIFDEASQIFPQDAIGAIFRSKQVIITGDSKQLPPTNFFSANTSNDVDYDVDDEDEEDVNFDSILEEASGTLPSRSLLWHYRSRYEELISFSNRQIYQNNLITFPSSTVQVPDTGVEYVYVENGVYDNRCNRDEAHKIVELVAEHIRKYPQRSLGIIAFSESQQTVIEDAINQYRTRNPADEWFLDEEKEEPFFVKNLENVQGDERDTIIFSICYAKNPQGRMYMRFGPLGHQGGERRLNVAITRAKHNVKLVGSILPEDMDLSKTQAAGVRMLRGYIAFALRGAAALPGPEKKNGLYDEDVFSREVGKFLTSRGCKVKLNVGCSDYTVDIAVEHPKLPGHYIAGIECDGNSYYMARTVRDREHLRTAVLERMGWKMHRVWSTEWIRNPEGEKERLMEFVRDALQHHGQQMDALRPVGNPAALVDTEVVKPKNIPMPDNARNPYNLPLYTEGILHI